MANRTNHAYRHGPKPKKAKCHPDLWQFGLGLCPACYHRQRRYNLTPFEFEALWDKQGGRCALCRVPLTEGKYGMHVDHDHLSSRVRGLLCTPCNHGLGKLGDTVESIERVLAYLRGELDG